MNEHIALRGPSDMSSLAAAEIERRLADLIRRYARDGSADLADRVVESLETLYGHPDLGGDAERFCAYRRLARHWRWLARRARPLAR
jgi:hypothetical protein